MTIKKLKEKRLAAAALAWKSLLKPKLLIAQKESLNNVGSYIKEYEQANRFNHESRRVRKLLLNRKEINKMSAAVQRKGMTIVTLKLYFNDKNKAKVLLGLAKGKKLHDKRATDKEKDWNRQKARLLKGDHQ